MIITIRRHGNNSVYVNISRARWGWLKMQTLRKAPRWEGTGIGWAETSPSLWLVVAPRLLVRDRSWLGLGTSTKSSASSGVGALLFCAVVFAALATATVAAVLKAVVGDEAAGIVLGGVERRTEARTGSGGETADCWFLRMNEWLKKSSNSMRSFALRRSNPWSNAAKSGEVPDGILQSQEK